MKPREILRNILKPFKSNSRTDRSSREEDIQQIAEQEQKHFSYDTLSRATDKFHLNHKLGEGGFGPVYKGRLDDGREIAVKMLSRSSRQGRKEFQNEAKLLARVQHRNAVNLLGYCAFGDEKLLVYEYVRRESLDKFLFKADRRQELDWKKRYDIITGVAKGLLYLHEHAHCCIIHRDIKASNILLDEKWVPKIADFGMARLFPEDQTHVNTRIAGTNGYMAPEYVMHGHLSTKADVFSFGVLMLELVSGQRNSSSSNNPNVDAENLLEWAFKLLKKDRSLELIDETIAPTAIAEEVAMCVHIGLLCTQSDPHLRPAMSRVVTLLSKRPTTMMSMEVPTRPGFGGTRYRRSRQPQQQKKQQFGGGGSSSHAGSSGASSTNKTESTSTVSTMTTTNNTTSRGGRTSDPRGKRPLTIE